MPFALPFLRVAIRRLGLVLGLALLVAGPMQAQTPERVRHCLMLPIEPVRRAQQAGLIVEAQVLDAQSFWNTGHNRLFTRHRLRIFSLLKGQLADTTGLVVVTEGGKLGLNQQILTNTLRLTAGQQGILFLTPAPWSGLPTATTHCWTPFGSQQGFIEYNPAERTASEPFRNYLTLDAAFYQDLARLTGQPRQVLRANPALAAIHYPARRVTMAPSIAGFEPRSLPAGTGAVLTIDGDGFGSSRGSGFVEFRNADDGGSTRVKARNSDYIVWTNNRIQVRVPSSTDNGHPAGSGKIRVTTNDRLATESTDVVTVIYALVNVESTDGKFLQRPNHVGQNASSGISFHLGPNFTVDPAALASWERALNTWRCQTGMNWEIASTSATNVIADDSQNVVAFDTGGELPNRVLGRTTSYYEGCYAPNGEVVFWVKEIDIQFDDEAVFQFGPDPAVDTLAQVDFESVAVHELGHAQQLSHLNLPGAVMHYAVASGQNTRSLDPASDIAGGRQVLRVRSFRDQGCGGPGLLPAPLTSFSAQYVAGAGVSLAWTTRDECFLSDFVVERSTSADTIAWERVDSVAPRPPNGEYLFTDERLLDGLHYYRLRLVRPDGSLDSTVPILLSPEGANLSVSIFPNPVTGDQLHVQYPAAAGGEVAFQIHDALGRQVRVIRTTARAGLSVLDLSTVGLMPGFYVLRWQDKQGHAGSRKFVRQ